MKIRSIVLTSAAFASAAPAGYDRIGAVGAVGADEDLAKRDGSGVCFVFARGSTEPSPIGILIGPPLQSALKQKFPQMKSFPVGYAARIDTNVSVQRTDTASINAGIAAFKKASGCGIILAGGYSQGAAVMHNVIPKLDAALKDKIRGVALFGDTRNKQDGGHIPNFPAARSKVWCNKNDGVCGGGLSVNAGHMSYGSSQIKAAASWLADASKASGS